jgi:hypothetical protein
MEIDPHTIQQILTKVRDQLRCPQCRKRVDVSMESLKVMGDDFAVMQLKCLTCDACIMLHASLSGAEIHQGKVTGGEIVLEQTSEENSKNTKNASTKLLIDPEELKILREHIKKSGGSFMSMFD